MDIMQLITNQLGGGAISKLSEATGESSDATSKAIQLALPTLLNAINNNTNEGGASSLLSALDRDHDGSILNDVMGFFNNSDGSEGNSILKHILGEKQSTVENGISQASGVSTSSMGKILAMLAPIVMGYLGRQKNENGINDSNGISDLLTNIVGSLGNNSAGGLDIGSILGMLGGNNTSNQNAGGAGGVLGLLGKLFGK